MHDDALITLPRLAARVLARALHAAGDAAGGGPAPIDILGETGVCLDPEILGEAEATSRLGELILNARRQGAACSMVRLGGKDGAAALLVSGDHVWRLVDTIDELQAALEALAQILAESVTPTGAAALMRRSTVAASASPVSPPGASSRQHLEGACEDPGGEPTRVRDR